MVFPPALFMLAIRRLLCYSVNGAESAKALHSNGRRKRASKSSIWSTQAYIAKAIVGPLYLRGQLLPPESKGGLPMSTNEVFQLCLVIIGICDLFVQIIGMKKK